MAKKSTPLLYISLASGIVFILLGLAFLLFISADSDQIAFTRTSIILLLLGSAFVFISIAISRRALYLYLGLNLCFVGISSLIFSFNLFDITVKQFWPVYMMFFGLSLVPSGYYGFRRFRRVHLFPACLLVTLGFVFSLFSFDIITISFSKFVSHWWPIFLILLGIVLIAIFLYQRQNKNSFPYISDEDDYDDDPGDEE